MGTPCREGGQGQGLWTCRVFFPDEMKIRVPGIRRVSSAQSLPTDFLMSSLTPVKTGGGITICQIRVIFSRSSCPINGNIQAITSGNRLGNRTGHDTDSLPLVGHRDPFPENPVEVRIFLVQVNIQMKTECCRGPGSFQHVAGSIRPVQCIKCRIQAPVIFHIRFGNQRSNFFHCGKDSQLFSMGMPDQDFVEKPEPPDGTVKTFLSPADPSAAASICIKSFLKAL